MKKTPPAVTGSAGFKLINPNALCEQYIATTFPKGKRYRVITVSVGPYVASGLHMVEITVLDTGTQLRKTVVLHFSMDTIAKAEPGDWSVLDRLRDRAVSMLVQHFVDELVEECNQKIKEKDNDLHREAQWSYVEKSWPVRYVRASPSGSASPDPKEHDSLSVREYGKGMVGQDFSQPNRYLPIGVQDHSAVTYSV